MPKKGGASKRRRSRSRKSSRRSKPKGIKGLVRTVKQQAPEAVLLIGLSAPLVQPSGTGDAPLKTLMEPGASLSVRARDTIDATMASYREHWVEPIGGIIGSKLLKIVFKGR